MLAWFHSHVLFLIYFHNFSHIFSHKHIYIHIDIYTVYICTYINCWRDDPIWLVVHLPESTSWGSGTSLWWQSALFWLRNLWNSPRSKPPKMFFWSKISIPQSFQASIENQIFESLEMICSGQIFSGFALCANRDKHSFMCSQDDHIPDPKFSEQRIAFEGGGVDKQQPGFSIDKCF